MIQLPQELPEPLAYLPSLLTVVTIWALFSQQKCFRTFRRRMAKEEGLRCHYRNCLCAVLVLVNVCFISSDDYYVEYISVGYTILLMFDRFSHYFLVEVHDHLSLMLALSAFCAVTGFFPIFWGLSFELFVILVFAMLYPSWKIQDMTYSIDWPDDIEQQDEMVRKYYVPSLRRKASLSLGDGGQD